VGNSEQRKLVNRRVLLPAHLHRWQKRSGRRSASWQVTIRNQRRGIARRLKETPSLRSKLADPDSWGARGTTSPLKLSKRPLSAIFPKPALGVQARF
jgi:hypothetical protein